MPTIHFLTSGKKAEFKEDEEVHLLRFSIRKKGEVPYNCASGLCATDRVHVEEGYENLSPVTKRERERLGEEIDKGYRLCCQTWVKGGDVKVTWDPEEDNPKLVAKYRRKKPSKKLEEYWKSDRPIKRDSE